MCADLTLAQNPYSLTSYGNAGIEAASNFPGARAQAAIAIDHSDNIWLVGGYGYFGTSYSNYGWLQDV